MAIKWIKCITKKSYWNHGKAPINNGKSVVLDFFASYTFTCLFISISKQNEELDHRSAQNH